MNETQREHSLTLYHFRYSMFPEKVRWALDYKKIPHKRIALLPGTHPLTLMPLAKQKCVPVLCTGTQVLTESSKIVEWLDHTYPNTPLFPQDQKLRSDIIKLIEEFDTIGPHARRAFFYALLKSSDYAAQLFCYGHPDKIQRRYRRFFPIVNGIMRVDMNISKKCAAKSKEQLARGLDRVAELASKTGYLVGDQFSAADLTASAVLMVALLPQEYPVTMPLPYPDNVEQWLGEWRGHPGADYVTRIYQQHRGLSAATQDLPEQ